MKQASLFSSSVQGGGKRREDGMSLSLKREEASVTASLPVITLRHITARGPYLATLGLATDGIYRDGSAVVQAGG
jgi:hypothetical protein